MRVALFGGSFNPPHVGHVLAVAYVLATEPIDRVVVVPVFEHALGKHLVSFEHRLAMARLAFAGLPDALVSELEAELGAPSRTLRTLEALQARHADWQLRLLVGSDILDELDQWHAFDRIQRLAPPLVMARAGRHEPARAHAHAGAATAPAQARGAFTTPPVQVLPDVSSTHVRALLLRRGDPHIDAELSALVPRAVLEYVNQHELYRPSAGDAARG